MERRIISDEVKAQICVEYQNKNIRTVDIRNRYHVNGRQMKEIIEEAGIPPRNSKLWGGKRDVSGNTKKLKKNVCRKCKKELANKEARFCWYCGSDVRSSKQIIIEGLYDLTALYEHIPVPMRDKYISMLTDAIKELEK